MAVHIAADVCGNQGTKDDHVCLALASNCTQSQSLHVALALLQLTACLAQGVNWQHAWLYLTVL